ncbi:MAG: 2-hydroxyacyl-CoA dehydratase [Oscillospiraceae bacterium]|jgi:predicted nucleotide-binding protein (sugar kinase/HSP70/actin superfamily)|nr:2-hydroxyacyl-CoA dehydratase [Oscillospiraceae bacterium]
MDKLIYDKTGRLLFTKEMKSHRTLLIPNMLPLHGEIIANCLRLHGYKCEILTTSHAAIKEQGLRYVHNDTCYPALLVIGQFIDALKSGGYKREDTALLITQTGGGCRASNYIHLLRKALKKAGYDDIPVVSLNLSGLEGNPGFKMSLTLLRQFIYAIMYGDILLLLSNQSRPYEINRGDTDKLVQGWYGKLTEIFKKPKNLTFKRMRENFKIIVRDFERLPRSQERKVRVGIVGEIYVKYSPLGNNDLEAYLLKEGAEPVVPGLADFLIFKIDNRDADVNLYGGLWLKQRVARLLKNYFKKCQNAMVEAIEQSEFRAPSRFEKIKELAMKYLGEGNKMGEGWLLTGEMLELIHEGIPNIVCTQPFGCLPNHIVGKGMIRALKTDHPEANIVAIDYDPGATKINQENRVKLMLSNAALAVDS